MIPNAPGASSSKGSGAIIGIVVGIVFILCLLGGVYFFCRRGGQQRAPKLDRQPNSNFRSFVFSRTRRQQNASNGTQGSPNDDPESVHTISSIKKEAPPASNLHYTPRLHPTLMDSDPFASNSNSPASEGINTLRPLPNPRSPSTNSSTQLFMDNVPTPPYSPMNLPSGSEIECSYPQTYGLSGHVVYGLGTPTTPSPYTLPSTIPMVSSPSQYNYPPNGYGPATSSRTHPLLDSPGTHIPALATQTPGVYSIVLAPQSPGMVPTVLLLPTSPAMPTVTPPTTPGRRNRSLPPVPTTSRQQEPTIPLPQSHAEGGVRAKVLVARYEGQQSDQPAVEEAPPPMYSPRM